MDKKYKEYQSINNYLNEGKYKKINIILKTVSIIVFLLGVFIGLTLIFKGYSNSKKVKDYNATELKNKLNQEAIKLEEKQKELKSKGIEISRNSKNGESYDLYAINKLLNSDKSYCEEEFLSNSLTHNYCSVLNTINDIDSVNFYYILAVIIIIALSSVSIPLFIIAYRRQIIAYKVQQVLPIAKEGIEQMAPTIGKAAGTIAAGIKEGLSSSGNNNSNNQ